MHSDIYCYDVCYSLMKTSLTVTVTIFISMIYAVVYNFPIKRAADGAIPEIFLKVAKKNTREDAMTVCENNTVTSTMIACRRTIHRQNNMLVTQNTGHKSTTTKMRVSTANSRRGFEWHFLFDPKLQSGTEFSTPKSRPHLQEKLHTPFNWPLISTKKRERKKLEYWECCACDRDTTANTHST